MTISKRLTALNIMQSMLDQRMKELRLKLKDLQDQEKKTLDEFHNLEDQIRREISINSGTLQPFLAGFMKSARRRQTHLSIQLEQAKTESMELEKQLLATFAEKKTNAAAVNLISTEFTTSTRNREIVELSEIATNIFLQKGQNR